MRDTEIEIIKNIHLLAFGEEEGKETAGLAGSFLSLPDTISINAERDGKIVGNILFTPFVFADHPEKQCYLLAPVGVLPGYQRGYGVGKELVSSGIEHLKNIGADAIFVLGVPTYYPQYGFVPSNKQTPYPNLLTIPEAWMELELKEDGIDSLCGKTIAVEPFMQPHWWDTSGRG